MWCALIRLVTVKGLRALPFGATPAARVRKRAWEWMTDLGNAVPLVVGLVGLGDAVPLVVG